MAEIRVQFEKEETSKHGDLTGNSATVHLNVFGPPELIGEATKAVEQVLLKLKWKES